MKNQIPLNKLKSVTSSMADRRCATRVLLLACVALMWVAFATATAQAQTLLSETTWGGNGSDVSEGVAVAADFVGQRLKEDTLTGQSVDYCLLLVGSGPTAQKIIERAEFLG